MEENAELKGQIVQLTAALRAHEAKAAAAGTASTFIDEIQHLSDAIKSVRESSRAETLRQAQQQAEHTIALHNKSQNSNSPGNNGPSSLLSPRRLAQLEDTLLTDEERKALRAQREKLRKAIDENFGAARVDAMVEEEYRMRKRAQIVNGGSSSSHSPTFGGLKAFNAAHTSATAHRIREELNTKEDLQRIALESAARARNEAAQQAAREAAYLTDLHTPLRPLASLPKISDERAERQCMLVGNATPLRKTLIEAQEKAMSALRRSLADEELEVPEAVRADPERNAQHVQRKHMLAEVEKTHVELVSKCMQMAAAVSV